MPPIDQSLQSTLNPRQLSHLTPKGLRPIFCLFLKFGQTILVRFLMLNF